MTKKKTEGTMGQDANKQKLNTQLLPSTVVAAVNNNNRQLTNPNTPSAYAIQNEYVKAAIRVFGTSVSIATALYPLEVIQMRKQMGLTGTGIQGNFFTPKGTGIKANFFNPARFNYQIIKPFVLGFFPAVKGSLAKNSVISNREAVSTNVDSVVGEKGKERNKNASNYKVTLIASAIIAGTDTGFTQLYANLRGLHAMGYTKPIPMFQTQSWALDKQGIFQRWTLYKQGIFLRGSRNYFSALACMESTGVVSDYFNPYLPKDTNPVAHNILTSFVGGFAVSPFINVADVLYRRKIKGINLETFETPNVRKIFTDLVLPEGKFSVRGVRALSAGTLIGGINGAVALAVLNGTAWAFDNYVFNGVLPEKVINWAAETYNYFTKPLEQPKVNQEASPSPRPSQSRNTFFASSNSTTSDSAKPQVVKEKVEQTQSTGPRA